MKCPYCKGYFNYLKRRVLNVQEFKICLYNEENGQVLRGDLMPDKNHIIGQDFTFPVCGNTLAYNFKQAKDILLEDKNG
jgi:hypothetical protein